MKRKQIQEAKFPNMILASKRKEKQYECVLKGKKKKNTMVSEQQSLNKRSSLVKLPTFQKTAKWYFKSFAFFRTDKNLYSKGKIQ